MSNPTADSLVLAFLEGAKWWEYRQTGCTMWQSDQREAMDEAERREARGTLGISAEEMAERMRKRPERREEPPDFREGDAL